MSTLVTALTAIFSLLAGGAPALSSDEATTPATEETNLSSTFEGLSSEDEADAEDAEGSSAEGSSDEAEAAEEATEEGAEAEAEATEDEATDEGADEETVDPEFSHVER